MCPGSELRTAELEAELEDAVELNDMLKNIKDKQIKQTDSQIEPCRSNPALDALVLLSLTCRTENQALEVCEVQECRRERKSKLQ